LTGTKHPTFSTDHLGDTDTNEREYDHEQHNNSEQPQENYQFNTTFIS